MRKITIESNEAFLNSTPFKKQNMEVRVLATENNSPCWVGLFYHGNMIAERHINKRVNKLKITNCGYFTNTTKERLNALPNVNLYQKKGVWYLNEKAWNGNLINIKQ